MATLEFSISWLHDPVKLFLLSLSGLDGGRMTLLGAVFFGALGFLAFLPWLLLPLLLFSWALDRLTRRALPVPR